MKEIIQNHLQTLFDLSTDLANTMDEQQYASKLANAPSDTLGTHLLSLVCAREKHLYLLKNKETREWSCSIDNAENKLQILQALFHSSADILVWLKNNNPTDTEVQIMLQLIECESVCHGRLMQYIEGNKWTLPDSLMFYYIK